MNKCTTQEEQLLILLSQLSPFAIVSLWHFPSVIQHLFQLYSYGSISSYLPLHIFIELDTYTLRYVNLGQWACFLRGWACPMQEKQLLLCLLNLLDSIP